MRLALAQTHPITGDVARNLVEHVDMAKRAARQGAGMVVFPELSLTGYEPALAEALATDLDDERFNVLQKIADDRRITIAAGMPTRHPSGILISMLIFGPGQARRIYSKQHLHANEEAFFVRGHQQEVMKIGGRRIVPAICYEAMLPEHMGVAIQLGADIYMASVAKSKDGVKAAYRYFGQCARRHAMTVVMVNCTGPAGGMECAGGSAVWDDQGEIMTQLGGEEDLLLWDP